MRIASLIPSATEIAFAIGAGDEVVAVSHECNYPPEAANLPVVTSAAIDTQGMAASEIDAAISAGAADGTPTYRIDTRLLAELKPDVILTQALCDVCAVSEDTVHRAIHEADLGATVVTLSPATLEDIFDSIEQVGEATGHLEAAKDLAESLRGDVDGAWERRSEDLVHVVALEWLDPPFAAGHWIPEQVEAAGGVELLGRPGQKSYRTTWDAVSDAAPDVLVLLPCGLSLDQVAAQAKALTDEPAWAGLPAVQRGAVWAVDADAFFSRPGPRVVEGVTLLAAIFADPESTEAVPHARRLGEDGTT